MSLETLPAPERSALPVPAGALDGEVLAPGEGSIRVVACPHPFKVKHIEFDVEAGLTLAEILARAQPDPGLRRYAHIAVEDTGIAPDYWPQVRPKPGTTVTVRVVPMDSGGGGGKKNPLRTLLTIAVLASAVAVSGGALGALGAGAAFAAGSTGALIGGTLIGRTGPVAVNWRPGG